MTRHPRGDGRGVDAPESSLAASPGVFPLQSVTETFTQSERAFQAQVTAYARLMGWRVWHDNATNAARRCGSCGAGLHLPRNASGLPDLILVRRPRLVFAELKAERGRTTLAQAAWLAELRACTQEAYLWRPSSWQEIERVLR